MTSYKINNLNIGNDEKCFIIAEIGVNHNGSLELAKKMVAAAKECGADAVKFQTFTSEEVCTKDAEMESYQIENSGSETTQAEMLKKLELSHEDFLKLKDYCDKKDILFLSTPHSDDAISFLEAIVPVFKLESGDITNHPRLKRVAISNKLVILSTGMCTLKEVGDAVRVIEDEGNHKIVLLQCTSLYPCLPGEVNLNAMLTIQEKFGYPAGYSDHTMGIHASIAAVALGATVIEKHFTLDRTMTGPDHKASIEPAELREMINHIRIIERVAPGDPRLSLIKQTIPDIDVYRGNYEKTPTSREKDVIRSSRKSIVSAVNIHRNDVISEGMLCIKRPGFGIEPTLTNISGVIGKVARVEIPRDTIIHWNMVGGAGK
ncbi:N-acetylneuraminate synthase family protein [Methanoregula sp.]|jgi:N,N'-diacetyllegionaminate synthase|uniref:N-acetylneuraminate synthase family protein n=1 Tax=Methanoregula sp. TaxID=2052170 RepID=UPI003C78313D